MLKMKLTFVLPYINIYSSVIDHDKCNDILTFHSFRKKEWGAKKLIMGWRELVISFQSHNIIVRFSLVGTDRVESTGEIVSKIS